MKKGKENPRDHSLEHRSTVICLWRECETGADKNSENEGDQG